MFALRQRAKAIEMQWFSRMKRATLVKYLDAFEASKQRLCDDVDAITLDKLCWPWFELRPSGGGGDDDTAAAHGFCPRVLARFYKDTDRFINPRTLQPVTHDDMVRLDTLLRDTGNGALAHNVDLFASVAKRAMARTVHADTTLLFERELDTMMLGRILETPTLEFSYACYVIATLFLPAYCDMMIRFLGHDLESASIKLRQHLDIVRADTARVVEFFASANVNASANANKFDARFVFCAFNVTGHLGDVAFRRALILNTMAATLGIFVQYVSNTTSEFREPMSADIGTYMSESVQEHWQRGVLCTIETAAAAVATAPSALYCAKRTRLVHDIAIAMHREQ